MKDRTLDALHELTVKQPRESSVSHAKHAISAPVKYEGDPAKAKANLRKHSVSFGEAATVFLDPLAYTYPDPDHSDQEEREITIGHSTRQRLLFVSHAQRNDRIRIISAREATRKERKQHEEGNDGNNK